ncbi:hypothetical protein [Modestobacter sp. SYSU DS0511]
MTTPVDQAVAARLRELTALADPPGGPSTAARAAALARGRRRRAVAWCAGAVAVVLLATGASFAGTTAGAPGTDRASRASVVTPAPVLYDAPVRGSLADDEEFLAAVAALDWDLAVGLDGVSYGGDAPAPEPGTQRVVYAGDVPGGHRWVVVIARAGAQWSWAWFTGPRGAEPAELTPAVTSMPITGRERLALMDVSADTGPLLVLAEPGAVAEYSPSLDRAPDGDLVRDFDPLPVVDGVPLGVVTTPITWGAGEVRMSAGELPVHPFTTGEEPRHLEFPTGPIDGTDLPPCLEQLGVDVHLSPDGHLEGWGDSPPGELSSAEQAAREEQIAACFRTATGEG